LQDGEWQVLGCAKALPTIADGIGMERPFANAGVGFAGADQELGRKTAERHQSLGRVRSIHAAALATDDALEDLPHDAASEELNSAGVSYSPYTALEQTREQGEGLREWGVLAKNSHVLNQALPSRPRRLEQKRPTFFDHDVAASSDIRPL
jgi:hypothetical protein